MAANALLKFSQSSPTPIVGDGEALKVVAGYDVLIEMSDVTDMATWAIDVLWVPTASTHGPIDPGTPVALGSGDDTTPPAINFQPDVPGSYRIRNQITGTSGETSTDIRVIAVPEANGKITSPYQRDPLPLEMGEQPNEMNFNGQPWGWAGDETDSDHPLGNSQSKALDRLDFNAAQKVYFGKHGNDSNDGLSPSKAKLTYSSAVTAASALTPSSSNQIAIVCLDAGSYNAGPQLPEWTHLFAPYATLTSTFVGNDNASAQVGAIVFSGGGPRLIMYEGFVCEVGRIECNGSGASPAVQAQASGKAYARIGLIIVNSDTGGSGIIVGASPGEITVDIGIIKLTNSAGGTGISLQNSGKISGRIGEIVEEGSGIGNGTGISCDQVGSGEADLVVGYINANTAIKAIAGGEVNAFVGKTVGTITNTAPSVLNLITANSLGALDFDYQQAVFFGKHGNDSNDGLSPARAKLTYGAAATAADGLTPSSSNQIAIVCLDGGTYTGGTALPTYCHLVAPQATFTSGITIPYVGSSLRIGELQIASGPGIHVTSAAIGAIVDVKVVRAQGGGTSGIQVTTATNVRVRADRIIVEGSGAYGVNMVSGEAFFDVGEIAISNNGSFGVWVQGGALVAHINTIHEVGSYAAVQGVMVTGGSFDLIAELISCDTAFGVGAYPTNVFAAEVIGTVSGSGLNLTTPGLGGFDYNQTIFVGKHGNDTNDGLNPSQAKLTWGSAITAASGLTPAVDNQIAIVCIDGGDYQGPITIPSYVHVWAPNAAYGSVITMSGNSSLRARRVYPTSATCVVLSGDSIVVELDRLESSYASGTGISNVGANGRVRIGLLDVSGSGAYGINAGTSSTRDLNIAIGEILLSNDNTRALYCTAGKVSGTIGRIYENGTRTNTAGIQGAGTWFLLIGELIADTAINTGAGTVNLFVGSITGSQTGDNLNVLPADHVNDDARHLTWPLSIPETSAPAGTPASNTAWLYLDSADGDLKVWFDDDTIVVVANKP